MTDAEYLAMEKSTIVRSQKASPLLPLVRATGHALSILAPSLAARLAERLFLTPPRPRRPAVELALLATGRARPLRVGRRHLDVWLWGHAMARPVPGAMFGPTRSTMNQSLGKIRFAHSDMSGLSLFEEACHWGHEAARSILS